MISPDYFAFGNKYIIPGYDRIIDSIYDYTEYFIINSSYVKRQMLDNIIAPAMRQLCNDIYIMSEYELTIKYILPYDIKYMQYGIEWDTIPADNKLFKCFVDNCCIENHGMKMQMIVYGALAYMNNLCGNSYKILSQPDGSGKPVDIRIIDKSGEFINIEVKSMLAGNIKKVGSYIKAKDKDNIILKNIKYGCFYCSYQSTVSELKDYINGSVNVNNNITNKLLIGIVYSDKVLSVFGMPLVMTICKTDRKTLLVNKSNNKTCVRIQNNGYKYPKPDIYIQHIIDNL